MSLKFVLTAAALLAAPVTEGVAAAPPNTLLMGTTSAAIVAEPSGAQCSLEVGTSSFKRGGDGDALIVVPGVGYSGVTNFGRWIGAARLAFKSPTAGTITFDGPRSDNTVTASAFPFGNYAQSYSADEALSVSFTIDFPDSCALPVKALYRNRA